MTPRQANQSSFVITEKWYVTNEGSLCICHCFMYGCVAVICIIDCIIIADCGNFSHCIDRTINEMFNESI